MILLAPHNNFRTQLTSRVREFFLVNLKGPFFKIGSSNIAVRIGEELG